MGLPITAGCDTAWNRTRECREHPLIHIDGTVVEKVESLKFLGVHITETEMVHPHRQHGEGGATAPLQPQEAEEIWLGP